MKVKILIGIIIATVSTTVIMSTVSKSENTSQNEEESFPKHIEEVATKLFAQKKTDKLSTPESNQSTNPKVSLEELAGHINKEYGIREDILRYIEKEIPADNEKAKKAAITLAQKMQFIYYKATQDEALEAAKIQSRALECLSHLLPQTWLDISRDMEKLMRNTPERDNHMWDIDQRYFSWKVLGTGISSTEQMKEICKSGNFE